MKQPTKKTRGVEKKVKAWAVYKISNDDIGDMVFETRAKAKEYLRENLYHSVPEIMRNAMLNYCVVKCTITYSLPVKKKK